MRGVVNVLIVNNLTFSYGPLPALKDVSLTISGGELTAILGPNGSGKTTLLKCLCALLKPKIGCVYINGQDLSKLEPRRIAQSVGYVPQVHAPSFPYRVIDVVVSGRTPHLSALSTPSKRDYEIAYQALERVGCRELAERPYTQLSGGELRLVLIARALAQQPKILLLDEPTSHLDFRNKAVVLHIIRDLVEKEGLSVLMSEHDPNLALMFSDKVVLMKKGRVIAYGNPREVINEKTMKELYDIDVNILSYGNPDSTFIIMPRI